MMRSNARAGQDKFQGALDMSDPFLSIVIPAYNRAAGIRRALSTIAPRSGLEVIVVDDGSRDDTAVAAEATLAELGLDGRVIRQANAGPSAARNTGAAQARGRWLVFLDSDDCWFPWTLERLTEILRTADPEPALLVLRDVETATSALPEVSSGPTQLQGFADATEAFVAGTGVSFGSCNLVMRCDVFAAIGPFTTEIRYCEDTDLILRASGCGPCAVVAAPAMVALSRGGSDHLTGDARAAKAGLAFLLEGHRGGRYPSSRDTAAALDRAMATFAVKLVRRHMETGHVGQAYRAYLRYMPELARGDREALVKLPLTPLLSILRPRNHGYFRWRPMP